jgi:hypothetical protein
MSTTISVLGGVGLFLLGMSVMTSGLKALAGSGLRATLSKAAATPLSGAFWGAFVTLIVQSSSATTMTVIGLVSAGLLPFSQGLGLVFGANVGTTGTGWLIALIGVRVSLTAAAIPMIFVGALIKLSGRGRVSAAGGAFAGFALVLFDTAARDGRTCRTAAPGRPPRCFRHRRQLVVELARRVDIDRGWTGDDSGSAIVDRSHRGNAIGPLRGSG